MTVVVRELIIRARVEEVNASDTPGGASAGGSSSGSSNALTEDIIAVCVEKVMEAIESKKER